MKRLTLASGLIIALLGGTAQAAMNEHDMSQMAMQPAASKAMPQGVGVIKAINAKAGKIQIAHEAIADLEWPPMTMWFMLHAPLPKNVKTGDTVRFGLMQDEEKHWMIVKIEKK